MKTRVLFLLAIALTLNFAHSQRGVRIGYIDTEYILENVPEYQEATAQLESKVQKWKTEIEQRLNNIEQKKNDLQNERVLLTDELIEERLQDIKFEEDEILDYQQKRFGPSGDLIIQKKQLMQPIQDQIFAAVQDIATNKKYDFVFDKSADVVMLYSAERFDMSEQVLRVITRSSKRKQLESRKDRKEAENEEVIPEINEELEARQKAIEDKRAEREKAAEERRQQILADREKAKQEATERRKKILEEREKAKQENLAERVGNTEEDTQENESVTEANDLENKTSNTAKKTPEQILEERKQAKLAEREARKKALEEKKQKILEEREKARQEKLKEREDNKNQTEEIPEDDE